MSLSSLVHKLTEHGKSEEGQSERKEIHKNGDEGKVGEEVGMVGGGLLTERIIHHFFLPQYFLSLICLLFFKLDPEPCPPAESLA